MKLSEAVRQRRLELGITQEDVVVRAREAGENISLGTVRGVEQGQRGSLRSGPKKGLAAGLSWPVSHIDHLIADQFRAECPACVESVRERAHSIPPVSIPESGGTLAAVFDMLSEDQRRGLLRGARTWVGKHPEYAPDLVGPELSVLDVIRNADPAAFAELTMDERVTLMTHLAQLLLGPRAEVG